jgi:hypothetical protein
MYTGAGAKKMHPIVTHSMGAYCPSRRMARPPVASQATQQKAIASNDAGMQPLAADGEALALAHAKLQVQKLYEA